MNISGICPYETPCHWCSKWDKKCDNKISGCNSSSQHISKEKRLVCPSKKDIQRFKICFGKDFGESKLIFDVDEYERES